MLATVRPLAQTDFSGEWAISLHEDQQFRQAGPNQDRGGLHGVELGDYTGLPITAAARMAADCWNAAIQTLPEHQTDPITAVYSVEAIGSLRISKVIDRATQEILAFDVFRSPGLNTTRIIWMDGRPHPPAYAAHTWQGFSTGYWEGNVLTVETSHIKNGYLHLNGVPHSDSATLVEHYIRHGNYLTIVSITTDPQYLEEPFIRTSNWVSDPQQQLALVDGTIVEEIIGRKPGYVPSHLPGTNDQLREFADRVHLPFEATRGGRETIYPEYQATLKQLMAK
jgi:hypothetical protein